MTQNQALIGLSSHFRPERSVRRVLATYLLPRSSQSRIDTQTNPIDGYVTHFSNIESERELFLVCDSRRMDVIAATRYKADSVLFSYRSILTLCHLAIRSRSTAARSPP
jgi:hypothetical protein